MRFLVGEATGQTEVFVVQGNKAKSLTQAVPGVGADLAAVIGLPSLLEGVTYATLPGAEVAVDEITPALPVANPPKIICLGLNYVDHIKEGGYEIPEYPALFMRSLSSMMPAGAPMVRPSCSEKLDYEVELMLIVGKGGRHISEADALDHVFGYTVFNDGSVRDYQRKTHQWTPGKNFDQTGAVGPYVVTPDELPKGAEGLKIESRVGGEILQSANTGDMMWSVARTIATISEYSTLQPGDLIAMGTPPGVGHAKTPPRWLRPGEVVEVEVEGIGICASPIVDEADMSVAKAGQ
jgi:2-keto-4-pentenoate hydratase/2-oxohepta-3-ene-1,7-dioic acid hydratase in catechol pathway